MRSARRRCAGGDVGHHAVVDPDLPRSVAVGQAGHHDLHRARAAGRTAAPDPAVEPAARPRPVDVRRSLVIRRLGRVLPRSPANRSCSGSSRVGIAGPAPASGRARTPPTGNVSRSSSSGRRIQMARRDRSACGARSAPRRRASRKSLHVDQGGRRRDRAVGRTRTASICAMRSAYGLSSPIRSYASCSAADAPEREARVVELRRLPRRAGVGEPVGIAGGVERHHRDLVHPDVVGVRVERAARRRR